MEDNEPPTEIINLYEETHNFRPRRIFGKTFADYEEEQSLLYEGLITSYGAKEFKKAMFIAFGKFIYKVDEEPFEIEGAPKTKFGAPNTVSFLIQFQEDFKKHYQELQTLLNAYGYFTVKEEPHKDPLIFHPVYLYQFEPKYPVQIDKTRLAGFRLFHITDQSKLEKIQKTGLNPKESNTNFNHPGNRIYLFATKDVRYLPGLIRSLNQDKPPKPVEYKGPEPKTLVLEVSLDSIYAKDLFFDGATQYKPGVYFAIFTLHCIDPSGLKAITI